MKKSLNVYFIYVLTVGFIASVWATPAATIISDPAVQIPGESVVRKHLVSRLRLLKQYDPYCWGRDTTELFWDDGVPEAYYVVSAIPGIYDRFAVRLTPPYSPPMKVVSGRFYTDNSVIALQSFAVCPDAGGYPDVFHPIDQVDTVYGGQPGWGSYAFHGALFDTNDIWAVVHWIPGHVVGIGADSTAPDGNSYWCNEKTATTWNLWTATDWIMRLSVATVTDSHDVTCTAILDPPGRFLPGDTAHPTAVFGNCGLSAETFDVTFEIFDSIGSLIYTSADSITLLSAEVETLVFMPEWVEFSEGMYTYRAFTSLFGDADPANDTVRMQGLCTREIVITYCGDHTNMGSAIIGTWATNRKYMVRMTPPISPPFDIRRAQIFLCDENFPMEYVCVCPDDGTGLPDTATILAIAYNISVPVSHTWSTADFGEIPVTQPGDLWVIEKWPEGITEPHIGMEINDPSTKRSWRYYFRNGAGHYENMGEAPYFREWYFRLIIAAPPVGIKEQETEQSISFNLSCTPNPTRDNILISYIAPKSTQVNLSICDATGRVVKNFSISSPYATHPAHIIWDGTDDNGLKVPAGVYFVQLKTACIENTQKAILLR